ncbi:MAG: electron transport complex subunit RsxC [Buchnera aphidicola (Floraphis meitanensis)]
MCVNFVWVLIRLCYIHVKKIILFRKSRDLYGGIECISMKTSKSSSRLEYIPIPKKIFILVDDIIVLQKKIIVDVGQSVLLGQVLSLGYKHIAPIHSPVSGIVTKISQKKYNFFLNKRFSIINIRSDGKDTKIDSILMSNYKKFSPDEIIQLIYNSGVVGLGGAGFLSSKKLQYSIGNAHTLVVNAAESEPYITSDDCLIRNFAQEVIQGCQIIVWILKIKCVLIAIEDDKNIAYIKIKKEIKAFPNYKIYKIKRIYPSGSSKQLIKILFNKEVPLGKHSTSLGIVVFNVSTIFSIKRAVINGEPLIERIVTLSDRRLSYQKNILVRVGTPINYILKKCNINYKDNSVVIGGPITGLIIDDLSFPILKTSNNILCLELNFMDNRLESPCIRCTACSRTCPMRLLPEQLYFYSKSFDHNKSREYHINECIECGICEQVCPSNIPLLRYFRKEKLKLNEIIFKENMSKKFKKLFISRQSRLNSSGLINENIIYSSNNLDRVLDKKVVCNTDIEYITIEKSQFMRKKELEESIARAKLKRNIE